MYKEFREVNAVVKTSPGYFNANAPDLKLVQSIQRSKRSAGGTICQAKQKRPLRLNVN